MPSLNIKEDTDYNKNKNFDISKDTLKIKKKKHAIQWEMIFQPARVHFQHIIKNSYKSISQKRQGIQHNFEGIPPKILTKA